MPQKPENIFPKFAAGDPASKFLDHKVLNSLTGSVASLSQRTVGQPRIDSQAGEFRPPILPGAEIRLGKVLEIQDASGDFKGPLGTVNVIKFEVIDALFDETVGQQDLIEQDASSNVIYAAAPTDFTAEVDDFAWLTKWSSQWWVLTGGGGSSELMFEIVDADASGSGCVDAEVVLRACGLGSPAVNDIIKVQDEAGCFFNVDGAFLVGVRGFATLMEGPPLVCDPYSTENCHWVVTSLCCTLGGCP